MKMKYSVYSIYLFLTILILTYSGCRGFVDTRYATWLEYVGYSFLFLGIMWSFLKMKKRDRRAAWKYVMILTPLFSIGIMVQDLSIARKVILLFTMAAIIIVTTLSENYLRGVGSFRYMAYGCVAGVLLAIVTCIIMGVPLFGVSVEGFMGIYTTFWGGIIDKNVATMMLAVIISLYIYGRQQRKFCNMDKITIAMAFVVLVMSNSRGAWIHFLVFFGMMNYKKLKSIKKSQRKIFALCAAVILLIVGYEIYENIILRSSTYMFRYRGMMNYLEMFWTDPYHMWFGIAEMVYDKSLDYVYQVRSITGWDGSLEMAWLNILIKNGLFGVIGFLIIFGRYFKSAVKMKDYDQKTYMLSIVVMMLITTLVATYIQTIHSLLGIYAYLLMTYFMGCEKQSNNYYGRKVARYENG